MEWGIKGGSLSVPPSSGIATAGAAGTNKSWHSQPQPEEEEEEKERRGGEKISPTRPPITRERRGQGESLLFSLSSLLFTTGLPSFSFPWIRACVHAY